MKVLQIISSLAVFISFGSVAQNNKMPLQLGAYYFDGWTGKTANITPRLTNGFPDREPIWGWVTSTPDIVKEQIDYAANAGITFFDFCWYSQKNGNYAIPDPVNNALNLFLKAPNRERLKFCIMVANHQGYIIKAEQWDSLIEYWCSLFHENSYLIVQGKPLITFYSVQSLIQTFGNADNVAIAFKKFKDLAIAKGFTGVMIAGTVNTSADVISLAEKCGFDVVTGYNYHGSSLNREKSEVVPIDSMRTTEKYIWDSITKKTKLPIIPAITLNWDHRPWDKSDTTYSPRFSGYSQASVKKSIMACKIWSQNQQPGVVMGPIAIAYAWNEYGEGAWLTPSKALKNSLLDGLKSGLKEN